MREITREELTHSRQNIVLVCVVYSRLLRPSTLTPESALFLAAIPGALFVGYAANHGVQQVRNPPVRKTDRGKPQN